MINPSILQYYNQRRFEYEQKCPEFVMTETDKLDIIFDKLKQLNPGGRFLELGSGLGIVTACAALEGYIAVGIEKERTLVNAAEKALEDLNLKHLTCSFIYDNYNNQTGRIYLADIVYAFPWQQDYPGIINLFQKNAQKNSRLIIVGTDNLTFYTKDHPIHLKEELSCSGFVILRK